MDGANDMKIFSPLRPDCSPGRKSLRDCAVAVPHLMVFPSEDETLVELRVFLPTDQRNNFRCLVTEVVADRLPTILADYREDPEHALFLYFNWTAPEPMAVPRAETKVQLVDQLGLI